MATSTDSSSTVSAATLTGCVKWFDNGLNYGFITVLTEGEHHNADIFVHQSNIKTTRDCYRTLYTGECVQFEMAKSDNVKHPFHAVNVSGYNGTLLHCENPNYRPRVGFRKSAGFGGDVQATPRGGRGGFRGGRGGYRQSTRPQQQDTAATTEQVTDTKEQATESETTVTASTVVSETTSVRGGRGRGRGRGKAASN
jgi:cold shock CspA family protein